MAFYENDVATLIDEQKLQARIRELGEQITRDYSGKDLTVLGVLKGSVFFATDLAKAIDLPVEMEFLGVSSYQGGTETTGEVRITTDVSKPMAGKHLLLVEDIIDTGLTMKFLLENLKARKPAVRMIAVEPEDSAVLSGGRPGPHKIQGIGAGFAPKVLDTSIYDEIIKVSNDDAFANARLVARLEGVPVGISSGAALQAATVLGQRPENAGKNIVVIIPSFAERYLSTVLFEGLAG